MSSVDILADLGSSADVRAVAKVLSAAAAPPRPHELRGYESARRAFESAGATPVRHSAGVSFRRLVGVKLAAVAGALTVTGVAVAAEADILPSPIQRAAHQMLGGVGVPEPDGGSRGGQTVASSPGSSAGHPGSQGSHGSQGANGTSGDPSSSGSLLPGTPGGTADPSGPSSSAIDADVLALCRTYVAHEGNGNGNGGLNEHDRKRLAALAGGEDKMDGFCTAVLAAASGAPTVPQPTGASTAPSGTSSATPSPSHDHKPNVTSSSPGSDPASSTSADGNGHGHTPNPTHSGHGNAS